MNISLPRISLSKLKNFYNSHKADLYKISLYEVIIMFTLLFIIYTMPIQVHRFSVSLLGKLIILLSVISISYYNVVYGIVLALLFIAISELGKFEEGYESKILNNVKGTINSSVKKVKRKADNYKKTVEDKADTFARKHEL